MRRLGEPPRRGGDVEGGVAVEVVDAQAPSEPDDLRADVAGDVGEAWKGVAGSRLEVGDAVARRNAVRISAEGEPRDVEEPLRPAVVGEVSQQLRVRPDG